MRRWGRVGWDGWWELEGGPGLIYLNTYFLFLVALWRRDLKWFEIQGIGKRACPREREGKRGEGVWGLGWRCRLQDGNSELGTEE
jgi:hypothetical protein